METTFRGDCSHLDQCDRFETQSARFIAELGQVDLEAPVPTCPGWSVAQLAKHLGSVWAWAGGLVAARAPQRRSPSELGVVRPGPDPAELATTAATTLAVLRAADGGAEMWAWGADQHVAFWSRRMVHETAVHRLDLAAASGALLSLDPALAADGIDELLANLESAAAFSPELANLRGDGAVDLVAPDQGRSWSVQLVPDGFRVAPTAGGGAAQLEGPAPLLCAVLNRRAPLETPGLHVDGAVALVELLYRSLAIS